MFDATQYLSTCSALDNSKMNIIKHNISLKTMSDFLATDDLVGKPLQILKKLKT